MGGEFAPLARRPAVLVLPGGGYQMCSDREADPVALAYLQAGFQAFVLRYATGAQAAGPTRLRDYEAAAALIRSPCRRLGPVPGQAGGHRLFGGRAPAACAAAMAGQRPNAAILGYPVIDKDTVEAYLPGAPDAAKAVDEHNLPLFCVCRARRHHVPVANTLAWLEALTRYDISYECHIYSQAGHAFPPARTSSAHRGCAAAHRTGWRTASPGCGMCSEISQAAPHTAPRCPARVNGNRESAYNVDCTLGYLLQSPAAAVIQPVLQPLLARLHLNALPATLSGLLFRQLAGMIALPPEQLAAIDTALHAVPKQQAGGDTPMLKPDRLFSDGMVLQQDQAVPVWGLAAPAPRLP